MVDPMISTRTRIRAGFTKHRHFSVSSDPMISTRTRIRAGFTKHRHFSVNPG
eukprot:COSAG01_NODE_5103_length_4481_cov_13.715883_3_plen_52_part_00